MTVPNLNLPQAARWQGNVITADYAMTERARLAHPAVVWWWGGRTVDGTFGAWCYLCNAMAATWSRAWPITQQAQGAILGHRDAHLAGLLPITGIEAPGTFPGAVHSTGSEATE